MSYSGYEEEEPIYEQRLEQESPLGNSSHSHTSHSHTSHSHQVQQPEQPQVIVESPLVQHDPSLTSSIGLGPSTHQQDPTSDLNVSRKVYTF